MLLSLPARLLLLFYVGFLAFYFVPWNLKNIEKADDLEESLLLNYGMVHSYDNLEITITHLCSLVCILFSLVSIVKCSMLAFASSREITNIWIYPITIFLSIAMAVGLYDKFNGILMIPLSYGSTLLCVHPMLAVVRGLVFHRVLLPKTLKENTKEGSEKHPVVKKDPSYFSQCFKMSTTAWYFAYWFCYATVSSFFYNEIAKYILQEHISMKTIMNFILV